MIEIALSAEVAEMSGLLEKPIYNYSGENISIGGRIIKDESATTWLAYENGLKIKRGNLTAKLLDQSDSIILIDKVNYDHLSAVGLPVNVKSPRMLLMEIMQLHVDVLEDAVNGNSFKGRWNHFKASDLKLADFRMAADYDDPPEPRRVDEGDVDVLSHFHILENSTTAYVQVRKDFSFKYGMMLSDRDHEAAHRYIDAHTSLNDIARAVHDIQFRDRYFKHILKVIKESRK